MLVLVTDVHDLRDLVSVIDLNSPKLNDGCVESCDFDHTHIPPKGTIYLAF